LHVVRSDNGGCSGAGGKNGPLRGTKGSLFEGGVKVDSFMWSPLLSNKLQGTIYPHLFNVVDWFPTLLSLSGIDYVPEFEYNALDGVDHYETLLTYGDTAPRDVMLYNYYYGVDRYQFDMWINGSFAIRNERYKLMHAYNSSRYAAWYQPESVTYNDDDIQEEDRCAASFMSSDGDFVVSSGTVTFPRYSE
jgi:arylsulfatase A-like enzyme